MERAKCKLLLLQIRGGEQTRLEEQASFAQFCGLAIEQIDILNLFDTPEFGPEVLAGYDALLVGGSSEASVLEPVTYPFVPYAEALLRHCIQINFPVFCSCFGHQLAVTALGGKVIRDERDFEIGTLAISLTPAASRDPLYADTPDHFYAVSVHRERALALPDECELLAYTSACTHSFRIKGKPFWTTQFHPEVSKQVLIERLAVFKQTYCDSEAHYQQIIAAAHQTPESHALLRKFIDRVVLV